MLKPIRIKLPDLVYRTRPMTVETLRDLILIRHQIGSKDDIDSVEFISEVLEDLFPDAPPLYRPYIFVQVYCDSRGLDIVHIKNKCKHCEKIGTHAVEVRPTPLEIPRIKISEALSLVFKYVDLNLDPEEIDLMDLFLSTIDSVEYDGTNYKWTDLDKDEQDAIIDLIDHEKLLKLLEGLSVVPVFKIYPTNCCDLAKVEPEIPLKFNSFNGVFKFLLNPEEIGLYYRSNKILINSGFSLKDIEGMAPMEKTINLKLIEQELKRRNEANGK